MTGKLLGDLIDSTLYMYLGGAVVGWNVVHKKKRASSVSRATRLHLQPTCFDHALRIQRTNEIWVHDTPYMMDRFKL